MSLQKGDAQAAGLDADRLLRADQLLERWAEEGSVGGSVLAVARNGILLPPKSFGVRHGMNDEVPMAPDAVFLTASVTKPVTATAAVLLLESGQLSLPDRATSFVAEFAGGGRDEVSLLHLMTHTSGLPDMLPENRNLRQEHVPLSGFIERVCQTPLLFAPGSRISYQSMGTALLGAIVEALSGMPLRRFFAEEIFSVLGMKSSSLGWSEELASRVAEVSLPAEQRGGDWHWNSAYWRDFGAPWGGMFSTVEDLALLLQCFLDGGAGLHGRLLGVPGARAMISDQTSAMPDLTAHSRRSYRWGLGWRLGQGDLGSLVSFGHGGATGTLVGADPATGLLWVIFTTQPKAPLHYVVNAIQSAVI